MSTHNFLHLHFHHQISYLAVHPLVKMMMFEVCISSRLSMETIIQRIYGHFLTSFNFAVKIIPALDRWPDISLPPDERRKRLLQTFEHILNGNGIYSMINDYFLCRKIGHLKNVLERLSTVCLFI